MSASMFAANSYLILDPKGARIKWTASLAPDVAGYEVWISANSGGPYSKLSGPLISGLEWVSPQLRYGAFWFVVTAVDQAGNRSIHSNEFELTVD